MSQIGAPTPSLSRAKPPEGWWETMCEWTDNNGINEKIQRMEQPGGWLVRTLLSWKDRGANLQRAQATTFVPDRGKK